MIGPAIAQDVCLLLCKTCFKNDLGYMQAVYERRLEQAKEKNNWKSVQIFVRDLKTINAVIKTRYGKGLNNAE